MDIVIHHDNQATMYSYFKKEEIIYFGHILPNILTFLSQKRGKNVKYIAISIMTLPLCHYSQPSYAIFIAKTK